MLTLTGTIRAAVVTGGGLNKQTGEVFPLRPTLQVEGLDNRGLIQLYTLTVPDIKPFEDRVGQTINVPVRAWASKTPVNLSYEDRS